MKKDYIKEAFKLQEECLIEMARVGWIPTSTTKTVEVYVRTDDSGKIPHFHIRKYSGNNDPEWETCIKYETAEYFLHGKYQDTLPNKLKKQLDDMLREDNPKDPGRTYWDTAVVAWNQNNSDVELNINIEQPNYNELK